MKDIIKNIDKKLLIVTIALFTFGLIMILSASSVTTYVQGTYQSKYFLRQLIFLVICFIVCALVIIKIPISKYKKLSNWLLIIDSVAILGAIIYATAINDTTGWISIPIIGQFQPSEFAKVLMIIWLASYYGSIKNQEQFNDNFKMLFPLGVGAIITILIIFQNDYGTAFVFFLITITIFFLSNTSKRLKNKVLLIGVIVIATFGILIATGTLSFLSNDKIARLNFIKPCDRYLNEGNQVCNSFIAINNGGIFGKGLGNSTQKYLYLPESHTDFIFAIIIEEIGLVGGVLLLLGYAFVLARIIIIGKKAKNNTNALICYGVAIYLFCHITINLGGVMGIIPITGIPLAFMSYGGSFGVSTLIALTLVQRVYYETKISNENK